MRRLDDAALYRDVAAAIAAGKVVGWFQGGMEYGPRALGNRSIVADPRRADMKDILNTRIKHRETYRPFAPSVLEERVGKYFERSEPSPFMLLVYKVRPEQRARVPAVTHVDDTGRLQTVSARTNPRYHALISEFERQTGVGLVLNTSFNEHEPIVATPADALRLLPAHPDGRPGARELGARAEMKVLLLNQFFHPDLSATAQIATDLAEDLAAAGLEVTALASRGTYLGGAALPRRERHRGVDVVRVAATSLGKRTLLHRAVDYASFYATASLALATLPRHDVVVALTTPPLIAATGLVAQALKRSRLVCWVQDLYPEIAVAFGALREGSLAARTMRGDLARGARAGRRRRRPRRGHARPLRRRRRRAGADPRHPELGGRGGDPARAPRRERAARRASRRGAPFVAMYSGNMGAATTSRRSSTRRASCGRGTGSPSSSPATARSGRSWRPPPGSCRT